MHMQQIVVAVDAIRHSAGDDDAIYSTNDLLDVMYSPQILPESRGFWLPFFPRQITSQSENILFDDVDQNERRLAPFVAPNVQGRMMRGRGYETRTFKPAYVKPKHVVDPSRAIPRRFGERLNGSLTLEQRYDAIIADNMRRERLMIENRWDWMGCQVVVDGKVVVRGEDYPETVVDFRRDPGLTITLTGPARWTEDTATPMADIALGRQRSHFLSNTSVNRLIFGMDAWAAFSSDKHADVKRLLDNMSRGGASNFNTAGVASGSGAEYQGFIQGSQGARLDLWVYSNTYEEYDGTILPFMDPGCVVGVGTDFNGAACFGAIMDKRAGLRSLPIFPKMWDEEDPSVTYTMSQSAPLMVPGRTDNTFKIKVL